jgi:hypothetical protein
MFGRGMKFKLLSRKESAIIICIREDRSVYFNIKENGSVI